jgi:hypothetical protein
VEPVAQVVTVELAEPEVTENLQVQLVVIRLLL